MGQGGAGKGGNVQKEGGGGWRVVLSAGFSLSSFFFLPSRKVMLIRKAFRLLYPFPSFWRYVYLPEGVIQWIHPPPPMAAPGQANLNSPSDHQRRREWRREDPPQTRTPWLWRFLISFISFLCCVLVPLLLTTTAGWDSPAVGALAQGKNERG